MKAGQRLWTREETILCLNLYCKIPFGQMDQRNTDVQKLASLIGRTPGAVARKLGNLASLDPLLKARGIRGLRNTGGVAEKVWNEFYEKWDEVFEQSDLLLAKYSNTDVPALYDFNWSEAEKGLDKERLVKTRLNQHRFRKLVLTNFNNTCCITGIKQPELLIASHITSWSKFANNRLNPANGLCLNALHDRAFDKGLITVSADDYTIRISPILKTNTSPEVSMFFLSFEGKKIYPAKKFMPNPEFLAEHNSFFAEKLS